MRPPADPAGGPQDADEATAGRARGAGRGLVRRQRGPGSAARVRGRERRGAPGTALGSFGARVRRSPRYRWWVLWVVLSGLLATNLLFTVFVVALRTVAHALHTSVSTMTWTVTGPMLAFGVVAPLAGKASDLWGHRRLFLVGVVLELLVACLSALAPTAGVLVVARVLGGMVGAAIGAASMALVLSVFDKGDRVKALGFWSLVGAGGPVIGVAVGGPVIEYFGWRWMFVLQMPLLALSALLAVAVLPGRAEGRRARTAGRLQIDWAGAAGIATCVGAFLAALNRGPAWGWTSPGVMAAFGLSLVGGVAFVAVERRAPEPVFPLHYLRRRNFTFPVVAQTCANFAYIGAFFLAPSLLESVFHYGSAAAGFLVLPRPIVYSLIAPIAGYVSVRVGERTSAVVGTSAVVASMGVFALAGASGGLLLVEVAFVLSGVGLGVGLPPLSASAANEFAAEDLGTASASQQLMNQVGTVAGIQVMATVQVAAAHGQTRGAAVLPSFHLAYVVGGVVALLGVAAAAVTRSTDRRVVPEPELVEALELGERRPAVATQTP